MDQTDPDHCGHCGLLVCTWSPCCEAWEKGQANQAADPDGPLVVVRVGPADGGYLVGPFTPAEAATWREENVTIPEMHWAIVPLLPPAARPAGADLFTVPPR